MRTVYLGTSEFAAAVLVRLAGSPHRPTLVVTRPDRPAGRGRHLRPPPVAERARELGIDLIQPEDLHAPEVLDRIGTERPEALLVCAYGVLIKEPLLSGYEMINVHPSLLPRWRGAAPIERAIAAGDDQTGTSIMRVTAGLDSGPVYMQAPEPVGPGDDFGTVSARLQELSGDLLVRVLDERPAPSEQDDSLATYAEKISARDRNLDPTRPPADVERMVRALRPHIGARIPLPDGSFLGVWSARPAGPTLAPAGGRVRSEGERLFLDCNGGALELLEIQPPGGRPMPGAAWLRGRPDPRLTDFWLDPRLPDRSLEELLGRALEEWPSEDEWTPHLSALAWRATPDVLEAVRALVRSPDAHERAAGAYLLGQLGVPERAFPAESLEALRELLATETDPEVLAAAASGLGHLGEGTEDLARLASHPDARVRDAVACALGGRSDPESVAVLVRLSADEDPGVRDWATFGLGALAAVDTPEVREALAERLRDDDQATRIEAVHGLALRGDPRAVEPALELLAGEGDGTVWERHALEDAAIRLAAASGDARFRPHLPEPKRWEGTVLEKELARALERTAEGTVPQPDPTSL